MSVSKSNNAEGCSDYVRFCLQVNQKTMKSAFIKDLYNEIAKLKAGAHLSSDRMQLESFSNHGAIP